MAANDPTHGRPAARSFLYVPGDRRDRLDTAAGRGADAVIVDLEDSVTVAGKAAARAIASQWLSGRGAGPSQLWVRVNADGLAEDLAAVVGHGIDGVVLPKAEPGLVDAADRLMSDLERRHGIDARLPLIGLVETARGLLGAADLATAPRVARLGIGEADLTAELRMRPSEDRSELRSLRLQVVVASAAAGIAAPVAPTSTDFHDLDALRDSTVELLRLGFRGRTAIHPAQVPVINEVFTPSPAEVERARAVVAAFEAAQRQGSGVSVDTDGRMIDVAVVRSARDVLAHDPHDRSDSR